MAGDPPEADAIKYVNRDDQIIFDYERCFSQVDDDGTNEATLCQIMRHSEAQVILHIVRITGLGTGNCSAANILKGEIPFRGKTGCQHHHVYVTMRHPAFRLSVCGVKPKLLNNVTKGCIPHQTFRPCM
jgi:hypothetical protein